MRTIMLPLICCWLLCCGFVSPAHPAAMVQMTVKKKTYAGKLVAHNDQYCWLLDQSGSLHRLDLRQVSKHRALSNNFKRLSAADIRDQLRREFGKKYEISGTTHYLVCAARGRAKSYAPIFEEVYRSFHHYLSVRGFKVQQPEFPLVAIVFPDQKSFALYCRSDGVTAHHGLRGYYIPTTNRIALFDPSGGNSETSHQNPAPLLTPDKLFARHDELELSIFNRPTSPHPFLKISPYGSVQAGLQQTIVHEATHQVAFNTGLHSRIGETPRWVVEGMATVFESPGIRQPRGTQPIDRINRERYIRFGNFVKSRRKPKSLASFISNDSMYQSATLDAYSQGWALNFFLIETRSREYSQYLKTIAERDPTLPYRSKARLADFTKAFGEDLERLDVQFLRFIDRLE